MKKKAELSPLLRMAVWEKIRFQFSTEEKAELNASITARVICPEGATIDEAKLKTVLRRKLRALRILAGDRPC